MATEETAQAAKPEFKYYNEERRQNLTKGKYEKIVFSEKKLKVCVGGGAGFIGSHIAQRLLREGHEVVCSDWKRNEFMKEEEFCTTFMLMDLRSLKSCLKCTEGCDVVFNLAADMGGMGFISSNESVLMFNNTMISSNMLEASRRNKCGRYFYSSSACVYNEANQLDPENPGLKESDAWPARPQENYGLEKLYHEEMAIVYGRDFPIETRIARFHNIYGPHGTWKGGREKAPAAFCRKAATCTEETGLEIWGDGKQTRSYCFIDDCVEGVLRLTKSDIKEPLNLGSDEMIDVNGVAAMVLSYDGKEAIKYNYVKGPQGVRGRNSDNDMIKEKLGWAPAIGLREGLNTTYNWIKDQIEWDKSGTNFTVSEIVNQGDSVAKYLDNFMG